MILSKLYRTQRVTLAIWAALAGSIALVEMILPAYAAHHLYGRALGSLGLLGAQRADAARLGLALVALVAAFQPKPPRALVWALLVALAAGVLTLLFARGVGYAPPAEVHLFAPLTFLDGSAALVLLITQEARALLVRAQARR